MFGVLVLALAIGCDDRSSSDARLEEDVDAVRAWTDFTRGLEAAGLEFLSAYPQPQAIDRAEGLRYMLQQVQSAAQMALIREPGQIPLLRIGPTTLNKWGMDGADGKYMNAAIEGTGTYRLYGQLGTARLFAIQLATQVREYEAYGELTGDQIETDERDHFEVLISRERPEGWKGHWLELNPEATDLIVREYFRDWANERPGTYFVQRVDEVIAPEPVTTQQMAELLNETVEQFAFRVPQWKGRMNKIRRHLVNKVYTTKGDSGTLATNFYGSGWFDAGEHEAVLIEMDAPNALMWSVQLGNVWWESIDFLNHTTSYNDHQATASSDGKYRFVIAHRDPGVPNWLDPAGHREGMFFFRFQQAEDLVNPDVKLVSFADLADHLPRDTPKVTVEQRRDALTSRRAHAAARWAP
jgi:hypothetical protein